MPTVILTEAAAYEVKDMLKANEMPDGYLKIKSEWWRVHWFNIRYGCRRSAW